MKYIIAVAVLLIAAFMIKKFVGCAVRVAILLVAIALAALFFFMK